MRQSTCLANFLCRFVSTFSSLRKYSTGSPHQLPPASAEPRGGASNAHLTHFIPAKHLLTQFTARPSPKRRPRGRVGAGPARCALGSGPGLPEPTIRAGRGSPRLFPNRTWPDLRSNLPDLNPVFTVRSVNHAIRAVATDAIPTKYRRDTAWVFCPLTLFPGALCESR